MEKKKMKADIENGKVYKEGAKVGDEKIKGMGK